MIGQTDKHIYTWINIGGSDLILVSYFVQFSSVQSLSCVELFATPWIAARQASLSKIFIQ